MRRFGEEWRSQRLVFAVLGVLALALAVVVPVLPAAAGTPSGTVVGWGNNYQGQASPPDGLTGAVAISAGRYHSLALKSDGTVVGWGDNQYGEASPPDGLSGVVAISAGSSFQSLALKSDGTVVGWGSNSRGQVSPPDGLTGVVAISAGYGHSLGLKSDGTVVGWGWDNQGQASPPVGLNGVVAISAGGYFSLALKSDGTVISWGDGGNGGPESPPAGLTGVVAIAAGDDHSLALKSDGTVVGWGDNGVGQASPPAGLSGVVAIAAGGEFSLALKSDGTVVGWGDNTLGKASPPAGLSGVVAISAGEAHSLALGGARPPNAPLVYPPVAGDHSATITWLKPDSDRPILGYTVTASPGGQTCSTAGADALTCTISGLTNGVNYTFTVTAVSSAGTSAPPTTPLVQVTVGTAPAPVTSVTPTRVAGDGTQVTLTWLAAASDPNLPVIGYRASALPGGNFCTTTGALSCTITGLTPGLDYAFTVVATNGVGASDPGSPVILPGDTTPPVVTGSVDRAPNTGGWFSGPVTVRWSASDPDNPVSELTAAPDTIVTSDGAAQHVTSGQVCDRAGNCATGTTMVSVDSTPPVVTLTGVTEGSKYLLASPPTPGCAAADVLSGLAGACQITVAGGNSNGVGVYSATASATDRAGNTNTVTVHYKVVYGWNGFSQPINDTAHQVGLTTSVFKAGSTVPAQFTLTDGAGHTVVPVSAPVWLTPVAGVSTQLVVDESVYTDPADSGSTYKSAGGQWKYNWKTSQTQAGYFWRVGVRLDDGETYYVTIALR